MLNTMKTKFLIVPIALVILSFFYGCAPVYIPTVVNTPLLSEQGEFQATLNTGVSDLIRNLPMRSQIILV